MNRVPGISVDENQLAKTPLMKKKFADKIMQTALPQLVACRLREGYAIRDVLLTKSGSQLEVRLVLPWRDGVKIHYNTIAPWPLDNEKLVFVSVIINYNNLTHFCTIFTSIKILHFHFLKKYFCHSLMLCIVDILVFDRRMTHVDVFIETHYYFLNDVMTPQMDKYRRVHSPYRQLLVKKFRQTMYK